MKDAIFYLSWRAPLNDIDLDPRRRELYGEAINWIPAACCAELQHLRNDESCSSNKYEKSFLIDILNKNIYSVLVVGDHDIALELIKKEIRFVFDPTDSHSLYFYRRFKALFFREIFKSLNSFRLYLKFRRIERLICEHADLFVTTGNADAVHLSRLSRKGEILQVGNGTRFIHYDPLMFKDDGCTIGFHGGMTWEPNRTTALVLAKKISKLIVNKSSRNIRILIAGRPVFSDLQECNQKNNVEICGFVENIRDWLSNITIYVMPMYQGSGVKNKLIEALAMGLPVVTNTLGAEALDSEGKDCVLIADSDSQLVDIVINLIDSPNKILKMRERSREYAVRAFKWEDRRAELHEKLCTLVQNRKYF